MAMYLHPLLWVGLAIIAIVRLKFTWLILVGEFCYASLQMAVEGIGIK
jgi:hypothetical protein